MLKVDTGPFLTGTFLGPFLTGPFLTGPFLMAPFLTGPFLTGPFSAAFVHSVYKKNSMVIISFQFLTGIKWLFKFNSNTSVRAKPKMYSLIFSSVLQCSINLRSLFIRIKNMQFDIPVLTGNQQLKEIVLGI